MKGSIFNICNVKQWLSGALVRPLAAFGTQTGSVEVLLGLNVTMRHKTIMLLVQ